SDRGWHRLNCGRPRRLPIPGGPRPTAADPGGLAGSCRTRRRGRSPPTPRSAPSTLPRPPPLLGGEPPSPVSCREEVHFRAPVRGLHLEDVEYLEPGVSQQPEPPRNREVELDPALIVPPVETVDREVVSFEALGDGPGRRAADDRQRRVGEEHELPPGFEQPVGFGDPGVGVTPDG